ncbi:MAG: M14 family metallopeptidase, partial [Dokdonella sp.]
MLTKFTTALTCCALFTSATIARSPPITEAERSGFTLTGRYQEVTDLCASYASAYARTVRCVEFGRSPQGRPMHALIASTDSTLTPELARERKRPVLLVQGGIHAGEIDGKDAGFLALRELLEETAAKGALGKITLVFVPVFNVDGHERFDAWNRPNQRGPEKMGWRTTAQNLNLNRDYMKADAAEMQAMLALIGAWDPIVYADLHVTNGAQFEHDISINIEPLHSGDAALRKAGRTLRDALLGKLSAQGSLPLAFYPSFVTYDDPASGFEDGVAPPRFSHGYMPLRNRFGVLVETHSWKDYATRVRATRNTIIDLVELTAADGVRWRGLANDADARAAKLGGDTVALTYKASTKSRMIDFRGY